MGDGDMSRQDDRTALALVGDPATSPAVTDADLIEDFLGSKTRNTLRAYDGDLRDFALFLRLPSPQAAIGRLLSFGQGGANRLALQYKNDLERRELASNTVRRRIAALRSVVKLARKFGKVEWHLDCESPRAEKCKDTRGPGDEGWKAMRELAAADAGDGAPRTIRDRAMLRVCHDLGLRVAELIGLDLEHIEVDGLPRFAWVLGKGRKERERLSLPANTAAPLAEWVTVRGDSPGPLFVRLDRAAAGPTRLTERSAARTVRKLALRAGVDRVMSPHKLRHHAISDVLKRNGGNIIKAQKFSRHADPKMLLVYLDDLEDHAGEMASLIADPD